MPFQNLPKDFRDCIKYKYKNSFYEIYEIFDMKCCFVQLAANIALEQTLKYNPNNTNLINEFNNVINTAKNDIYTDILNFINNSKLSR